MTTTGGTVSIDELISQLRQTNMSMIEKTRHKIESLSEDIFDFENGLIEQSELNSVITEEKRKILERYVAAQEKSDEAENLKWQIAATNNLTEEEFELLAKYETLNEAKVKIDDERTRLSAIASSDPGYAEAQIQIAKLTTEYNNAEAAITRLTSTISSGSTALTTAFNGGVIDATLKASLDGYIDVRDEASKMYEEGEEGWKKLNKSIAQYNKELRKQNEELNKAMETYDKWVGGLKKVWNYTGKIRDRWREFNHATQNTAKAIGMTHEMTMTYQRSLMHNSKELAKAFGLEYQQVVKIQDAYANATNRATLLSSQQLENVAAISKIVGEDTANTAIENMDKLGGSVNGATSALGKAMAKANSMGLNAVKASAAFAKNMSMANKYSFKDGVDGISRMTMLAQKLKFDLQSAGSVIDKFSTIEGAISTSANLQMMGGEAAMMFSNPMEAMSMALTNPEQLIEKMTKTFANKGTFNKKTGEVDIVGYNLQWIKKTAEAMGMNGEEAVQIAKQTQKIKEIDKQLNSSVLNNEQLRSIIESKAEYNKEKQRFEITYLDDSAEGGMRTVDLSDIQNNPELIKQLESQKEPVEDIQLHVRKIAMALTSTKELEKGAEEAILDSQSELIDGAMNWYTDSILRNALQGDGPLKKGFDFLTDGGIGTALYTIGASILVGLGGVGATVRGIYKLMKKNQIANKARGTNNPSGTNNPTGATGSTGTTSSTSTTGTTGTTSGGSGGSGARASRFSARGAAAGGIGGAIGGFAVGIVSYGRDNASIEKNDKKREEGISKMADSNSEIGKYMRQSGMKTDAMTKILDQQRMDIKEREEKANTARLIAATTTGALVGAAIGSVIPGVGTAVIGAIGAAAGAVVGGLTIAWAKATEQIDERDALDMAQEDYETAKFGATSVNDPILAKKRDLAVLAMHDLLISIWYHLNGRQSNGAKETSFWDDFVLGGATLSEWWNDSYKKNEAQVHSARERGYINGGNESDDLFVRSKEGTSVNYAGHKANEGDIDSETPKKITINPTSIVAQDIKKEAESGAKPSVVVANENETVVNKEKITNLGNAYNELVSTTNAAPIINHKNALDNNTNVKNVSSTTTNSLVNSKVLNQESENYIKNVDEIKNGASKIIIDEVRETSLKTLVPMFNKITSFIGGDVSNVTTSNGAVEQYPLAQVSQLPTIGSQANTVNTVPSLPNYNVQPPSVDIPKMDMTINLTGAIDLRSNGMNNGFKLDAASLAKEHPEFINSLTYILMDSIRQKINGGGTTFGQRRS